MWSSFIWPALFLLCLLSLLRDARRPARFPPGPAWMPIFGNYLLFKRLYAKIGYTHLVWQYFSKKYGPLVGLKLGRDKLVVATGQSVIRTILSREQFDARPDGFFFRYRALGGRYGIVFTEGEYFNEQKKFLLKHLKNFGLNKSIMEDRIMAETGDLIQEILRNPEKQITLPESFEVWTLNSLWALLAGDRFRMGDPKARRLFAFIHTSFRLQDMSGGVINQLPFLRFLVPQIRESFEKLTIVLNGLISFIEELVADHKQSIIPGENRDFIDSFINEMESQKKTEETTFTEKQLIILVLDMFLAGAETTSSTLGFAVLYLIHNPGVQRKIQAEMAEALGDDCQPTLKDRNRLVYLEAFTLEVQRIANVSPTTVSHRAKEDTEIEGYVIPKDSVVLCNLYSMHMDREHWGDPEVFRPERFLDENGKIIQDDWLLPFGFGKRRCLGESLARTNIFLFLSSLLFHFEITARPGSPLPPISAKDGATLLPTSYQAVFTPRRESSPAKAVNLTSVL